MSGLAWILLDEWHPHDRIPIALADRTEGDYPDAVFDHWDDDGLGPATGVALRLPSGRLVGLFWHEYSPMPGLEVYADVMDDPRAAFDEMRETLELAPDEILWISPRIADPGSP